MQRCAIGTAALTAGPILAAREKLPGEAGLRLGMATRVQSLNGEWRFGGKFTPGSAAPEFSDAAFTPITLPHAVCRQSWQNWDPAAWQDVWIYRRHFSVPESFRGQRVFLHLEGVMTGAMPTINGRALPPHYGGYLPFRYEITELLRPGGNVLALAVDARWSAGPPDGSAKGPSSVDYLRMGGIHRTIRLEAGRRFQTRAEAPRDLKIVAKPCKTNPVYHNEWQSGWLSDLQPIPDRPGQSELVGLAYEESSASCLIGCWRRDLTA